MFWIEYIGKSIKVPMTWRMNRYVFHKGKSDRLEVPNDLAEFLFQNKPGQFIPCNSPEDEKTLADFKAGLLVYKKPAKKVTKKVVDDES